jgi:triosephosphate isomerase
MHFTTDQARKLAEEVKAASDDLEGVQVVLGPPHTALSAVAAVLRGSRLLVAAQDMHWADEGPFTGEISPTMVSEFADCVILGHSERRHGFGEDDGSVNRKVHAAYAHDLQPIMCIGETEPERDADLTDEVVVRQLTLGLQGISSQELANGAIAYEPVWAIGTGRACDPMEAQRVGELIRNWLSSEQGDEAAGAVRLLYGGSVKPDNISYYLQSDDIDGALVGGASLTADSFLSLIRSAGKSGPPLPLPQLRLAAPDQSP